MIQFQLLFDPQISALEKENKWKTAADMVYRQWRAHPDDLNCLLCAGTQLWYTVLAQEYLQNDPCFHGTLELALPEQLQKDLMEVTRYGFAHFSDNAAFLGYFGYMIKVMPYLFPDYNSDYDGWQKKGIGMMQMAYQLDPMCPFAKAMNFEVDAIGNHERYFEACKELWTAITPEQWGNSEVQQYFFRILCGERCCPDAHCR